MTHSLNDGPILDVDKARKQLTVQINKKVKTVLPATLTAWALMVLGGCLFFGDSIFNVPEKIILGSMAAGVLLGGAILLSAKNLPH